MAQTQPGIVGPDSYPVRDPRDPKQTVGRLVNFPRYTLFGGFDGAGRWNKTVGSNQASGDNMFALEKGGATGVRAAHSTAERKGRM